VKGNLRKRKGKGKEERGREGKRGEERGRKKGEGRERGRGGKGVGVAENVQRNKKVVENGTDPLFNYKQASKTLAQNITKERK
jgi:hypothetical protein